MCLSARHGFASCCFVSHQGESILSGSWYPDPHCLASHHIIALPPSSESQRSEHDDVTGLALTTLIADCCGTLCSESQYSELQRSASRQSRAHCSASWPSEFQFLEKGGEGGGRGGGIWQPWAQKQTDKGTALPNCSAEVFWLPPDVKPCVSI